MLPNWHRSVSEKCFQELKTNRMNQVRSLFLYFQSSWDSVEPHKEVILSVHFVFVRYAKCGTLASCLQFPCRLLFCRKNAKSQLIILFFFLLSFFHCFFSFFFFLSSNFAFQCLQVDRCLTLVVFNVCVK